MTPKEEFTALYQAHITRPGADKLLAFLEKSDFFLAPASTRFHLACRGGLDRKSTRLNSSHSGEPRMPSSA